MIPQRIAFVFSGQGTQEVGMMAWMFAAFPEARETMQEAAAVLAYDLGRLVASGPESRLRRTEHAQPALLAASIALRRVLGRDVAPAVCAGHSLGEYSALVATEAIAFSDALRLVALRGRLMQEAVPASRGGMLAVLGISTRRLQGLCDLAQGDGVLEIAAYNCPGQRVVAGTRGAIRRLGRVLERERVAALPLAVSVPFHCRLLRPVVRTMKSALAQASIVRPRWPLVSSVDARVCRAPAAIRRRLVDQICAPVRWESTIRRLVAEGVTGVVEIGPSRVLLDHVRRTAPRLERFAVTGPGDVERVRRLMHG